MCVSFENKLKMILGLIIYLTLVIPNIKLKLTFSNRSQLHQTYLTVTTMRLVMFVKRKELRDKMPYLKYFPIHRDEKRIEMCTV